MPYRFFNIGRVCSLLCALAPIAAVAQLDWDNDVVVFGTEQDERQPHLVTIEPGVFRAFCVRDDTLLSTRKSQLGGEAWASFHNLPFGESTRLYSTAADNEYSYVLTGDPLLMTRIAHPASDWSNSQLVSIPIADYAPHAGLIFTDAVFAPDDPHLHGISLLQNEVEGWLLHYFRSEDQGLNVQFSSTVDDSLSIADTSVAVSGTMTWSGEDERLWVAVAVDRPGSTGEQIRLYYSDEMGLSWSAPLTPDSSSYAQYSPVLVGQGETIVLSYSRRTSASLARDIFVTYSPDNGVSWAEPMQMTDHAFDDVSARVVITDASIGLLYARVQVQQSHGQLFFRSAPTDQPWRWEASEVPVTVADAVRVSDAIALVPNGPHCAAAWTSEVIGDDGDIVFDGEWRGLAVESQRNDFVNTIQVSSISPGAFEFDLPRGKSETLILFDVLGRTVLREQLGPGRTTWRAPYWLPSGTYWLSVRHAQVMSLRIAR